MNQLAYLFLGKPFQTPLVVCGDEPEINDHKHCNYCGRTMTTDEFPIKKMNKDGTACFRSRCRDCTNLAARSKEAAKKCL